MTMIKVIVCSLAFFSAAVFAEGSVYQIELILFSQSMPNTEVFNQSAQTIHWPSGLTELSAYKKPENTSLDASYAALSKDPTYQPIMSIAWIQPVEGQGVPVHIQSSDGKLNGYVQMQQDQGLQMMVDLELRSNPGNDSSAHVYRLNEIRPIKLNEVYYLDHPKFGGIVKIGYPFKAGQSEDAVGAGHARD